MYAIHRQTKRESLPCAFVVPPENRWMLKCGARSERGERLGAGGRGVVELFLQQIWYWLRWNVSTGSQAFFCCGHSWTGIFQFGSRLLAPLHYLVATLIIDWGQFLYRAEDISNIKCVLKKLCVCWRFFSEEIFITIPQIQKSKGKISIKTTST